jgi:hypothetical protein
VLRRSETSGCTDLNVFCQRSERTNLVSKVEVTCPLAVPEPELALKIEVDGATAELDPESAEVPGLPTWPLELNARVAFDSKAQEMPPATWARKRSSYGSEFNLERQRFEGLDHIKNEPATFGSSVRDLYRSCDPQRLRSENPPRAPGTKLERSLRGPLKSLPDP